MSKASREARAERRASVQPSDVLTAAESDRIDAVALVQDSGGHRLVVMSLPPAVVEMYTRTLSEPEVLSVTLGHAIGELERGARGEVDADGQQLRPECSACGARAIVRHPTKPVDMCAHCSARFEVA